MLTYLNDIPGNALFHGSKTGIYYMVIDSIFLVFAPKIDFLVLIRTRALTCTLRCWSSKKEKEKRNDVNPYKPHFS